MKDNDIIFDPVIFRNEFLKQVSNSSIDSSKQDILNILLYFIWLGITKTRNAILTNHINFNLGWLCLATFKSCLPIIQNIRLGYPSDSYILYRSLMERIALLGFLDANPEEINKYLASKDHIQKDAMKWAKNKAPQNWMFLYNQLSNVAHTRLAGTAGYIFDYSLIGVKIQESMPKGTRPPQNFTDELLMFMFYTITAIDTFTEKIINFKILDFSLTSQITQYFTLEEISRVQKYFSSFIARYE
jgi:hypothetical protein